MSESTIPSKNWVQMFPNKYLFEFCYWLLAELLEAVISNGFALPVISSYPELLSNKQEFAKWWSQILKIFVPSLLQDGLNMEIYQR